MTVYYTALSAFDQNYDEHGLSWESYLQWSRLTHIKELVSLDNMLNINLVGPDYKDPERDYNTEDWKYLVTDGLFITGFYTSLDYVLRRMQPRERFNLLAVVINPTEDCKPVRLENFDFMGYELLDWEYGNSALTNCGGFDETFLPAELNQFGLIDDYQKAYDIHHRLCENNPDNHHADTNVIAIWRHKTIGRKEAEPPPGLKQVGFKCNAHRQPPN
ncbi:hypothetical protein [Spirosoma taeanense]|uniref:hypothetical protein n=1 Tax=Spirosoma taeanense TaxID=2735870 RepID=UPI0019637DA9|nr:hypothetical protein [Spirosoma taeanense]